MIKCLFCNHLFNSKSCSLRRGSSPGFYEAISICPTGHRMLIEMSPLKIKELQWWDTIPGRITHVNIYLNDNTSLKVKLSEQNENLPHICSVFVNQQFHKRIEIGCSRRTWLLCAIRLGIIKDIRILIGKYMNYEPFQFWRKVNQTNLFRFSF